MARRAPRQYSIRGLLHRAAGPLVRLEALGPEGARCAGLAVLDTGASKSAIDQGVARQLELPSPGAASWFGVTDAADSQLVAALRRGSVRVADDTRFWELDFIEVPGLAGAVQGYTLIALLGWDFLDQCRLTCDGPSGTFTLELPKYRGSGRRRR